MTKRLFCLIALGGVTLTGCGGFDAQDEFLLGNATRANIAAQSVRPVDAPNETLVEGQSGDRAVTAVKRHREGNPTELRDSTPSGTGAG